MDDADREPANAPTRKRRGLLVLLLFVLVPLGWFVVGKAPAPVLPTPPAESAAVVEALIVPVVAVVPVVPILPVVPVTPPRARVAVRGVRAQAAASASASTVVIAETVGGDALVRQALLRAFTSAANRLDVRESADRGYRVTLHVDEQRQRGDAVTVRCALSVALLPKKNVLASLRANATVEGVGSPVDELYGDAAGACGQALGKDLGSWVRAHPL